MENVGEAVPADWDDYVSEMRSRIEQAFQTFIIAAHGLLHHCYVDDTQIYLFYRPSNLASLKDRVLSCIDDIELNGCN